MAGAFFSTSVAFIAAATLVLGSAIPLWRFDFFQKRLGLLIGFSAGLMLATALHELIPEALKADAQHAMWGTTFGFLTLYAAERLTHFHACRHRKCEVESEELDLEALKRATILQPELEAAHLHPHSHGHPHAGHSHAWHSAPGTRHSHAPHSPTHGHADSMALAGMSIHNFADGLTTAAAFSLSRTVGFVVLLAIVLHQLAAGLSLGAIMLRVGRSTRRLLTSTLLSASCIVWGALFFHLLPQSQNIQGIVLGLAGGSFLYVAACDLLPEAHAEDEGWSVMAMTFCGFFFALII